jgi:CRISPR-associated exonuclease Cas4
MCLEEMLLCSVDKGYLFYDSLKRRVDVMITKEYRDKVINVIKQMQDFYVRKHTPKVETGKFCQQCSLLNICVPTLTNKQSVKSYIDGMIKE